MALSIRGAGALLVRIPTALFPIALGLAGLGGAFRIAAQPMSLDLLNPAGFGLLMAASVVLAIDVLLYLVKLIRNRQAVADDITMATQANLLAPGFMAAMVIGGASSTLWPGGQIVWLVASLGHLILLFGFVGLWLTHDYAPSDLNPTWFLPAAGIMTSAMSWPSFGPVAFPIFSLGIGAMLWIMLVPLVFRRLVFEPAVAPELRPTLFIIAAPFALFAGALLTLFPDIIWYAPFLILSGGAFFVFALVLQTRFILGAGMSLSWWATTFPVATIAAGLFRISDQAGEIALYAGGVLLLLACLTTAFAIIATFRAAWCTCLKTVAGTEAQIEAMQGGR